MKISKLAFTTALASTMLLSSTVAFASSHREAIGISERPKVDNTDVYAFRSYEPGREAFTTIISNFYPLQDPQGGPNYFPMDPDAIYEIHVDSDGDARENFTFQFDFNTILKNGTGNTVRVGDQTLPIALRHIGQVTQVEDADLGVDEDYSVTLITGDRRTGTRAAITNANGGAERFKKPFDNVGNKTIPNYPAYAAQFIYEVNIPGCAVRGRVFVGQREEAFAINLGEIFDLFNLVPIEGDSAPGAGDRRGFPGGITQNRENDDLVGKKNITSLAIEVPTACLNTPGNNGVIGIWSSSSLPQTAVLNPAPGPGITTNEVASGAFVQVSRLGAPLVNELVIGQPQKNLFNAAVPTQDGALAVFVTNPTLPAILNVLFRDAVNRTLGTNIANLAPSNIPRRDLVATFLTGIATLNQQRTVTPSEMLRLNTAVDPTPRERQSTFGVAGDDLAGYPNGRRPGDDAIDITLRVAMGRLCYPVPINGTPTQLGLCRPEDAPVGNVPFTDGAPIRATELLAGFPYLRNPIPGSPGVVLDSRRNSQTPQDAEPPVPAEPTAAEPAAAEPEAQ
jgi:hypothetical protein